jgi:hypothetical protein
MIHVLTTWSSFRYFTRSREVGPNGTERDVTENRGKGREEVGPWRGKVGGREEGVAEWKRQELSVSDTKD